MRLFRSRIGGGAVATAAIMTLVMIACAKGVDGVDFGDGGIDDAAVVLPSDSGGKADTAVPEDAGADAPVGPLPTGSHVVINEVQVADDEFVELLNPTSSEVSLANWEIRYASTGGGAGGAGHKFGPSATIPPNGYLLLRATSGTWTEGMGNGGGQIGLFNALAPGGTLIDGVAYGSITGSTFVEGQSAPVPGTGISIARRGSGAVDTDDNKSDFTVSTTTSPGTPN
jgi:hypothetical protein